MAQTDSGKGRRWLRHPGQPTDETAGRSQPADRKFVKRGICTGLCGMKFPSLEKSRSKGRDVVSCSLLTPATHPIEMNPNTNRSDSEHFRHHGGL